MKQEGQHNNGAELLSQLCEITDGDPAQINWFLASPKERLQPKNEDVRAGIEELQRFQAQHDVKGAILKSLPASLLKIFTKAGEDMRWVSEALSKIEITFFVEAAKAWFREEPQIAKEVERRILAERSRVSPKNFTGDIFCRGRKEIMHWLKEQEFPPEIRLRFMKFVAFCKGTVLRVREGAIPAALLLAPAFYMAGCEAMDNTMGAAKTTSLTTTVGGPTTAIGTTLGTTWGTWKGGKKVVKKVKKWGDDEDEE